MMLGNRKAIRVKMGEWRSLNRIVACSGRVVSKCLVHRMKHADDRRKNNLMMTTPLVLHDLNSKGKLRVCLGRGVTVHIVHLEEKSRK